MKQPETILFIGLSCIGDVIMTTPIIRSLHQQYPNAVFDFVADARSKALYDHCPYKRNIYIKDKKLFLRGLPSLLTVLWKQSYDLIVDVRTDGLAYLLRGKQRFTKFNSKPYGEHAVEKTMGVIYRLHRDKEIPDTKVWVSTEEETYAAKQLSLLGNVEQVLSLSLGEPGKPHKNWPQDKYKSVIDQLVATNKVNALVVLGGPNEYKASERFINELSIPAINLSGNSLLQTAAILKKCMLYIGPDSGIGHIAGAMGTPTISFFSTASPKEYLPWSNSAYYLQGDKRDASVISVEQVMKIINNKL